MRKKNSKNDIKNKFIISITLVVSILLIVSTIYLVYNISLFNGIENLLRLCACIILILLCLIFIFCCINLKIKKKKVGLIILLIIMLILSIGELYISSIADKAFSTLDKITNNKVTYSSSIITLSKNSYSSINDVKGKKIGMISDENNIDCYQIPKDIIAENNISISNIVKYEDVYTLMDDLYDGKIDAIFAMTNYTILYSSIEKYTNIANETKIIYTKTKNMEKQASTSTSTLSVTKPFTLLIMGIDSTLQDVKNGSGNGDALMLVTFNPKTLNATVLSIPRDTFVPIMCFKDQRKNKITHSGWYGEDCVEKTIENFTGIDIDYYITINFKGVVGLVDALGGVDIDVPFSFCEQDSNRLWGENEICLTKGFQHLNGEQALAFARHRKTLKTGDIQRGLDQQIVIEGILNKAKDISSVSQVVNILDVIGESMDTNFTRNQILEFYEVGKNILASSSSNTNSFKMQQLFLNGYGAMIYDSNMKLVLYDYIYYDSSLAAITKAMRVNLELEQPEIIKTFSFSSNTPYETTIIGKNETKTSTSYSVVPSFVGDNKSVAIAWANKNGKTIKITEIPSTSSSSVDGTVLSQSVHANSLVSSFTTLTIAVVKKSTVVTPDKIDEDNSNNDTSDNDIPDPTSDAE